MLVPCEVCRRHVRADAAACVFCDAPLVARPPRAAGPRVGNLTRAAIFYFGASVASACGVDAPPEETIAQPYGAPPDPEPPPPPPEDDSPPAIAAPYGAPPPPPEQEEPEPAGDDEPGDEIDQAVQQGAGAYGAPPIP